MPLASAARLLSFPLRKGFKAAEYLIPGIFHPEQILSKSPQGKNLFNLTMRLAHDVRMEERPFHSIAEKLFVKHGVKTDEAKDAFFTLLEWPNYVKRAPSRAEIAQFPTNVRSAVIEHLRDITDPVWKAAKVGDSELGYIPGYFTHFPSKSARRVLENERRKIVEQLGDLRATEDAASASTIGSLESKLVHIENRLGKLSHLDDTLAPQRYGLIQKGGYYGPMDEHRRMMKEWGYKKNYNEVMHDYISGAYRKIFLDRYMPLVKPFFKLGNPNYIVDDALRTYAYDYVQAQRGTLGAKSKVFFNAALQELFPAAGESRFLSRAVDEVTRFHYFTKIGLSARFPLVNLTQPLLTTYPLVGGRVFGRALSDAFRPQMWEQANKAGVIFEPWVRRAVTEFFGPVTRVKGVEAGLRAITYPATLSEKFNRVLTYAAGIRKAATLGMKGDDATRFAIKLVDDTQFRYFREAMPLFMSQSAIGRVVMQFRTFTASYVNYLTKLFRNRAADPEGSIKLVRALGSLMVLSGTSAFPMWRWVRNKMIQTTGMDIGEWNPIEMATEQLGLDPGINLGASLEPFNFPYSVYSLLGPTLGPLTEFTFRFGRDPDEMVTELERLLRSAAPPIMSGYRRLGEKEARKVTPARPEGRVIGERPLLEKLYLRPPLESVRYQYMRLIGSALSRGDSAMAQRFVEEARQRGVLVDQEFMRQARAQATKIRRR